MTREKNYLSLRPTLFLDWQVAKQKSTAEQKWTSFVVCHGFDRHCQASVQFPLTSTIDKYQLNWNKFSGMPIFEPEGHWVRTLCYAATNVQFDWLWIVVNWVVCWHGQYWGAKWTIEINQAAPTDSICSPFLHQGTGWFMLAEAQAGICKRKRG